MKRRASIYVLAVACLCVFSSDSSAQREQALEWRPVEPAELALAAPKVEAEADAEALFWDVRLLDRQSLSTGEFSTVFDNYVRIKIFTDRGREAYSTVNINYRTGTQVQNVAARTIKPDGTIVELRAGDLLRRTTVKADDVRESVVSFAAPALEKGAILEYRWRELIGDSLSNEWRLPFSRELPVHITRYYVRPLQDDLLDMKVMAFNGDFTPFVRQRDGYHLTTLTNIRAEREEPFAFPEYERGPWMLLYYQVVGSPAARDTWLNYAKELDQAYALVTKPNDPIRDVAQRAPAGPVPQRSAAIMRAILERVKRVNPETADAATLRAVRSNKNAADALRRGLADGADMVHLFLAVAKAAGLDARIAGAPNREYFFFKAGYEHPFFRRNRLVAVRDGNGWFFVDPANPNSNAGSLRWQFEGTSVLIADPKVVITAPTPLAEPDRSQRQRTGTFRLSEDGTLEGEVRFAYTGHAASTLRDQDIEEAEADRERSLRDLLTARWPRAEVSEVKFENLADVSQPYAQTLRVRIPGYATRTGTRLLFQPAVFQKGLPALFTSATRSTGIYFRYPWSEQDTVTIDLPAGFELEPPAAPQSADAGVAKYNVRLTRTGNTQVSYARTFSFGEGRSIVFEPSLYESIKGFFDDVRAADGYTLVLRRLAAE